jgi:hemerythrin
MDRFEFTPDVETGNRDIDAHVRTLFASANEVLFSQALDESPQELQRALRFFVAYLDYHFASEETVMAEKHYPSRHLHSAFHANVLHEARAIEKRASSEGSCEETRQAVYFMVEDWLIYHVQEADRHFADFLRESPPREGTVRLPGIRELEAAGSFSLGFDDQMIQHLAELEHLERLPWISPTNGTPPSEKWRDPIEARRR